MKRFALLRETVVKFVANKFSRISKQPINSAKRVEQNLEPNSVKNNPNTRAIKMNTVQELEQERKQLEEKVYNLVDQLESKKKPEEIRVPKEAIIRSKAEREASSAIEQLNINDEDKPVESKPSQPAKKSGEAQKATGRPKGGAKEPAAPERAVDVSRLDLRIGKIVEVGRHPDADALYVEKIDCGDETGPRTIISGLVKHVPTFSSVEGMVMCASTEEKVELLQPPENVKPGDRVIFDNYIGEPDSQLNPKKKIWEQIAPDVKTNEHGIATYKGCEFKLSGSDGKFKSNLKNVQIR